MNAPRLALISLQNTTIDFGVRYVAAAAVQAGISVEILWLCREPSQRLSQRETDVLIEWIDGQSCGLVGMGLMSIHFSLAVDVTRAIQDRLSIPVIWGGIHPILAPEPCLDHADYVCAGDGEEAVPALMRALSAGQTQPDIPNIWYRRDDGIHMSRRELVDDLNAWPPPHYDLTHQAILEGDHIVTGSETLFRTKMPWSHGRHYVISSRGCPHQCTYCCNSALQTLFGKAHAIRIRTVANLMKEITDIIDHFPFSHAFAIMDDSFFFKPPGWIEAFCDAFASVNAGFGVLIHPRSVSRERMQMLVNAGLIGVQMGLQSGSDTTSRTIYHRHEPVSDFIRAAGVLDEFMDRLLVRTYDVIVDNPFETDADRAETVHVLSRLNKPFHLDLFSLTLYPGTALYDRARDLTGNTGMMRAEDKNYLDIQPTMLNRLTWLTHTTPGTLIRFFLKHRHACWCVALFHLFDFGWERGGRVCLRWMKRTGLRLMFRMGSRRDNRNVIMRGEPR
ncbi:B12-binding domain-containing radical SAM protein [bacterium]|nr:B12-binding domain-containing radical SAM protein [candidate division CSSED10-310 bacterium]